MICAKGTLSYLFDPGKVLKLVTVCEQFLLFGGVLKQTAPEKWQCFISSVCACMTRKLHEQNSIDLLGGGFVGKMYFETVYTVYTTIS